MGLLKTIINFEHDPARIGSFMKVRIYRPSKTATSSGRRKTRYWLIEPVPCARKQADRLIGWVGSDDTTQQIQLRFPDQESAVAYCKKNGIDYEIHQPQLHSVKAKSYAENFIRRV